MNKDLLNQLPADEQPIASRLDSVAEGMQLSPVFETELETQLMDAYKTKTQHTQGWRSMFISSLGWAVLIIGAIYALNWTARSLAPTQPSAPVATTVPELSFADQVRQGNICAGPLALAHGFNVFLTNEDKTGFVSVDTENTLDELRSFAWSTDGEQLAIIGNTTGQGSIYIADPTGEEPGQLLFVSEVGYLRDAAWSRDGQQFALWSSQNMTTLYLLSALGDGLIEKQLDAQILGTPQFTPDGDIVFYGADRIAVGLFLLTPEGTQRALVMYSVKDESGFALSPDGSLLAYMEYDQDEGEARLSMQKFTVGEYKLLGTLPIPMGSGSSVPKSANLSWSADGTLLVFDFGQFASQRAIYLARADGSGLTKIVESGYAPAISSDGRCLAYISGKQVFLLDLAEVPATSAPVLLADLPAGRNTPDLDKLQWKPSP